MKSLMVADLTIVYFFFIFLLAVLDEVAAKNKSHSVRRAKKSTTPALQVKEGESDTHTPCEVCKNDEYYELENSFSMFPTGHCFGLEMPSTLTLTGLGMVPHDWWHAQTSCQRFGGYLYEPIGEAKTLDHMKFIATEAHKVNCPKKGKIQDYWTGLHFHPDLFNQNKQAEIIGASTGMSLDAYIKHKQNYRDFFYDPNPSRNPSISHPNIFESCIEMSSSTHQDSIRVHGKLNDDDCWVNNLPVCAFSYISV